MDSHNTEGNVAGDSLPPPPPIIPPGVVPLKVDTQELDKKKVVRAPVARNGLGARGRKVNILTNHFKVDVSKVEGFFFHYSVAIFYEDGQPVDGNCLNRKIMEKLYETYRAELAGKDFAYDGDKSLFTAGPFPLNRFEFIVVLTEVTSSSRKASPDEHGSSSENDKKRHRRSCQPKRFRVEISFATKIPTQAIKNALRGQESENSQAAMRVLDIILRQQAWKEGCLLVRQSFFHNDPKNFAKLGGGVHSCWGFHSSFRATQGGLSLNVDVSTTTIINPGRVLDFLIEVQKPRNPSSLDWVKAKRALKNLRIKVMPSNQEYRITGLSELPCREQTFTLKSRGGNGDGTETEVTVYDYFVNYRKIKLSESVDFPCINVGKPKRPSYFPVELCSLVSLQRYTKALSTYQRTSLVKQSRQKPTDKMHTISNALRSSKYDSDPMLRSCGISIDTNFAQVQGRVLPPPQLKFGNGEDFVPRNGQWNFHNKKFVEPSKIERWAIVNFSARCDIRSLVHQLISIGEMMGIRIGNPLDVFEERSELRRAPPKVRVTKMFEVMESTIPINKEPEFLLCLLPEKNSSIYGPWKRKNLVEYGIVTQCMVPSGVNKSYLSNLLLKINAKFGGLNSVLSVEHSLSIPVVSSTPTIIFGMDVSHRSHGQPDIPSIAAVVGSRQWPFISRYRASVRTQSPKVEMIDSLFKKVSDKVDEGIIRELLVDFYSSSHQTKPKQIIIFRDGVSDSQFNQVLNIELDQIIQACKFLDENWDPKFVVLVAQKNHHTKFFLPNSSDNVPPGTVIDSKICHPRSNDFYLCVHAGMMGTTRPTHYHVLWDEVGFSPDDLQELVHSLSYVYQRSSSAISLVAPVYYAHLAAAQVASFTKFEEASETSSSHGGLTSAGPVVVPKLPCLAEKIRSSMFFC